MFRRYEDPRKLEKQLEEELARQEKRKASGEELDEYDYERVQDLKERMNFAWQDDEYDALNCHDEFEY